MVFYGHFSHHENPLISLVGPASRYIQFLAMAGNHRKIVIGWLSKIFEKLLLCSVPQHSIRADRRVSWVTQRLAYFLLAALGADRWVVNHMQLILKLIVAPRCCASDIWAENHLRHELLLHDRHSLLSSYHFHPFHPTGKYICFIAGRYDFELSTSDASNELRAYLWLNVRHLRHLYLILNSLRDDTRLKFGFLHTGGASNDRTILTRFGHGMGHLVYYSVTTLLFIRRIKLLSCPHVVQRFNSLLR